MLTVAELLRGPRPAGWEEDPLEHLSACHRRVEERLETLARAGEQFAGDREEALLAIDASLSFFATNGVRHTADEEESFFPRLLPRLSEEGAAVINSLEKDHVEAGVLHAELDELVDGLRRARLGSAPIARFQDCVRRLTTLYHRHIQLEDTEVAALARRHLSADDFAAIRVEMRRRRSPESVR